MPLVHIRREADKLVRVYVDKYPWDGASDYMWGDGNYSCDCNRALFFARAVNEDEPEETPCGDELYTVKITDDAGRVLYEDDRWATPPVEAGVAGGEK